VNKEIVVTKPQIKTAILDCARKLGHPPNRIEFANMTGISRYYVEQHFQGFNRALKLCHMKPSRENRRLKLPDLLCDWANVARKLNHLPTIKEYLKFGRHNELSLRRRFRSWHEIGRGFREYAQNSGRTREWRDILEIIAAHNAARHVAYLRKPGTPRLLLDRPVYGPLMHTCQMVHGPVNESGVVYLFGTMAERLGFVVMYIQSGFPDCEAMRRIDQYRWQRIFIEFEYESRNYRRHRHPRKGCDLIVCWKHNWPDCPFEVLELSKLVGLPRFAQLERRSK
jgi:hypothetical protein